MSPVYDGAETSILGDLILIMRRDVGREAHGFVTKKKKTLLQNSTIFCILYLNKKISKIHIL